MLRRYVAEADFSGIPGLVKIGDVTVQDNSGNVFGGPDEDEDDEDDDEDDGDGGVTGVRGTDDSPESSSLSAGGYVGVAVAGLVLLLLALFASRRRRRRRGMIMDEGASLKHHHFEDVDDDEDEYNQRAMVFPNASTDDESNLSRDDTSADAGERAPRYRIAHVVEDSSVWDTQSRNRFAGHEQGIGMDEALQAHSCSSPNCVLCQAKNENPITFLSPGEPPQRDFLDMKSRDYITSDTVQL